MRFLLDQSADARLIRYLRERGHHATRIGTEHAGGLTDDVVLALAYSEHRILITDDRDFGDLVFRQRQPHLGVIYLRLGPECDLLSKVAALDSVLTQHANELDQFIVVTERSVRIRRSQ